MYINRFHTYMVFLAFLLSRGAILSLKYHIPPEHAAFADLPDSRMAPLYFGDCSYTVDVH